MNSFQYASTIKEFFLKDENSIIGMLTVENQFDTRRTTTESWKEEIQTIKIALQDYQNEEGFVAFEYTLPRVDGRIDVIIGLQGVLFVLEFKTGDAQDENADKDQLTQYVSDLKNYHFETYDLPVVPIWVVPKAELSVPRMFLPKSADSVFGMMTVGDTTIAEAIKKVLGTSYTNKVNIDMNNWLYSPYCPTANIVDAARKL